MPAPKWLIPTALSTLLVVLWFVAMDDCDDRISRLMTSISGRGGRPRADLGVNRTYVGETSEHTRLQQVLTANAERLHETSTMLAYGNIDFETHEGPDIWASDFEELYASVYPQTAAKEAMDRKISQPHLAKRYVYRYRYVLACLVGHLEIWQKALQAGYQRSLVLEDDVDLHVSVEKILQEVWRRIPDDWDMLLLGYDNRPLSHGALRLWYQGREPKQNELIGRLMGTYGLYAYVVRDKALPLILESVSSRMNNPVDDTVTKDMTANGQLKIYAIWPTITATQLRVDSLIQGVKSAEFPSLGYNGMAFAAGAWNRTSIT